MRVTSTRGISSFTRRSCPYEILCCHHYATPTFFKTSVVEKVQLDEETNLSAAHCCTGGVAGVLEATVTVITRDRVVQLLIVFS